MNDIETGLIVGLATLGVVISLVLFLVAIRNRRIRRVSSIGASVLTVISILAALWGMGFVLRARAPVPDDVMLFGGTGHEVFALKANDLTPLWNFSLPNSRMGISQVQDGVVYVSADEGVYALAANNGHQLWHSTTAVIGSISNGVMYGSTNFSGPSTQFSATAVNDGRLLWQVPAPTNVFSNLVPSSGLLFVGRNGDEQDEILALDAASGHEMWKLPLNARGFIWLTAGSDGTVYGAAGAGNMLHQSFAFALNPSTRTLLWQHPLSAFSQPSLTLNERMLYVGTGSSVVALDADSGNETWHFDLSTFRTSSFVIDQGMVYFGAVGGFYALKALDGSLVWKHVDKDYTSFDPLLVSHGVVFSHTQRVGPTPLFSDTSRYLYAWSESSGQQYYRHYLRYYLYSKQEKL
jgi:outer membrane protein assembly factor BamB